MKREDVSLSSQHSATGRRLHRLSEGQGTNSFHQQRCALLPGVIFESVLNYVTAEK